MRECSNSHFAILIKCSNQANIYWCNIFLSSHKSSEGCLKVLNFAVQSMTEKKKKSLGTVYLRLCNDRSHCGV